MTDAEYQGQVTTFAVMTVVAVASAAYGFVATSDCRAAKTERAETLARARVLPPPYGVPPGGNPPTYWPPQLAGASAPDGPSQ